MRPYTFLHNESSFTRSRALCLCLTLDFGFVVPMRQCSNPHCDRSDKVAVAHEGCIEVAICRPVLSKKELGLRLDEKKPYYLQDAIDALECFEGKSHGGICEKCKKDMTYPTTKIKSPPFLCFELSLWVKQFKVTREYDSPPFGWFEWEGCSDHTYKLIAIVQTNTKLFESIGHFTATVSHDDGKTWWYCDDCTTFPLGRDIDRFLLFQERLDGDTYFPRMLVYKRCRKEQ